MVGSFVLLRARRERPRRRRAAEKRDELARRMSEGLSVRLGRCRQIAEANTRAAVTARQLPMAGSAGLGQT